MIQDVREFNAATGIDEFHLEEEQAFRIIAEETAELGDAIVSRDVVGMADAFADIVFATLSCAERLGFPMQALWDEVVRSNMTKVGGKIVDGKLQKPVTFEEPDFSGVMGLTE